MDYKYIEQLMERYWKCETTVEEERILRSFFSQKDIPSSLAAYKDLFLMEAADKEVTLSDDFEARILEKINKADSSKPKARIISFNERLKPLYRAVAAVAIVLTLGNAIEHSFKNSSTESDYNYDTYKDTYNDPNVAYEKVSTTLQFMSENGVASSENKADSLKKDMQSKMAE